MLTYSDALALLTALDVKPAHEQVSLANAFGRVLAQDICLSGDQPPFDRATMDGYALCLKPGTTAYPVRGVVYAGSTFPETLQPGEAVRIMTGAPVPNGTTVVPHELSDRGEQIVIITDPKARVPDRNIAWRGEDGLAGAVLVKSGTRLSPLVLSVAAMAGAGAIAVARAPRAAARQAGLGRPGATVAQSPAGRSACHPHRGRCAQHHRHPRFHARPGRATAPFSANPTS